MTRPADLVRELSERRRELMLDQPELARRIGVSPSAVSRWERRRASPSLDAACALAEELGLDLVLRGRRGQAGKVA